MPINANQCQCAPFLTGHSCTAGVAVAGNIGATCIRLLLTLRVIAILTILLQLPVWNGSKTAIGFCRFCRWPSTPPFGSIGSCPRSFLLSPSLLHPLHFFLLLPLHLPFLCPGYVLRPWLLTLLSLLSLLSPGTFLLTIPPLTFILHNVSFGHFTSFLPLFCLPPSLFLGVGPIHRDHVGLAGEVEFAN